jgi:hypothetical protein
MRRVGALCLLALAPAVFGTSCSSAGDGMGAPMDGGIPGGPTDPAPTGNKWQGVEVEECGRTTIAWVLVDEVCAGTDDPNYLATFRTPMFRDGAMIGSKLFTVDATHLWVLEATSPDAIAREALIGGLGQPLAVKSHGADLVMAAGSEGLLVLDVTDPAAPVTKGKVALPGPALDVHVDADRAYVAVGNAGIAVIDLGDGGPALLDVLSVPGFAAAVTAAGGRAYVAACDTLAVLDLATGALLGQTWVTAAYEGEILVAPAKDVEIVGDVAFVAAGRYGAVAVDVSTPAAPEVLGNCTIVDDLSFYASGVRAKDGRLFVAGGEWGILPVDVTDPAAGCAYAIAPALPPVPGGDGDDEICSSEPPWQVLPWQDLYAPPPPGKDPIQTLPVDDVVYAFGDARRIGARAVDVRVAQDPMLEKIGRYDEPRLVRGIAARNDRVLLVGAAAGVFVRDDAALLAAQPIELALPEGSVAGALLDDGRWAVATELELHVEGSAQVVPLYEAVWSNGMASHGSEVLLPLSNGVQRFDAAAGTGSVLTLEFQAQLPPAIAADAQGAVFLASPEWPSAYSVQTGALSPHGVFDAEDIMNANLWRVGMPRRLLVSTDHGLVEVASLADRAGLSLHSAEPRGLTMPAGTYVAGAAVGSRLYLVAADRSMYRSQLITIALEGSELSVIGIDAFTGVASGVAVDGDRLYVADADRGVRVYHRTNAAVEPLGVVELAASAQVTP